MDSARECRTRTTQDVALPPKLATVISKMSVWTKVRRASTLCQALGEAPGGAEIDRVRVLKKERRVKT